MASKGVLRVNWEDSYQVHKSAGSGAHMLLYIDGTIVKHLSNATMLKKYYHFSFY